MNPGIYRRNFLQFLVASPLLSVDEKAEMKGILNVMDFEAKAKAVIPPAHFGYLSTGVDDDKTLRANMARSCDVLPCRRRSTLRDDDDSRSPRLKRSARDRSSEWTTTLYLLRDCEFLLSILRDAWR